MNTPLSLAVIALAGLIHASFQLSVSVLTMLSAHTIGTKRTHARLLRLTTGYVLGALLMTVLLLALAALVLTDLFNGQPPKIAWAIICGLLISLAVAVWLFYYRREKGTMLWIPRNFADYLTRRVERTKMGAEAFGLGLSSVVGELLFIAVPIVTSALVLVQLPALWQLVSLVIYTLVASLPLIIVWALVSSGHSLSRIQKWRESNKYFLQSAAGFGLIILSLFIYVNQIMASLIGGA
jgi:divalent metal cation (Fe/Co/Zn/Cd) transporter